MQQFTGVLDSLKTFVPSPETVQEAAKDSLSSVSSIFGYTVSKIPGSEVITTYGNQAFDVINGGREHIQHFNQAAFDFVKSYTSPQITPILDTIRPYLPTAAVASPAALPILNTTANAIGRMSDSRSIRNEADAAIINCLNKRGAKTKDQEAAREKLRGVKDKITKKKDKYDGFVNSPASQSKKKRLAHAIKKAAPIMALSTFTGPHVATAMGIGMATEGVCNRWEASANKDMVNKASHELQKIEAIEKSFLIDHDSELRLNQNLQIKFTAEQCKKMGIEAGDEIEVSFKNGQMIITKKPESAAQPDS